MGGKKNCTVLMQVKSRKKLEEFFCNSVTNRSIQGMRVGL